jgi:hypothetical protein
MVYGVKWPALADLRALFVERHGPQEWLCPESTEWPVSDFDIGAEEASVLNDLDLPLDCRRAQAQNGDPGPAGESVPGPEQPV